MTRDEALAEMTKPSYEPELLRQDTQFVLKKFGLTGEDFDAIIKAPPKRAIDYPSNYLLFHRLGRLKNVFRHIATTP
jgi:hypothetical protein